MVEMKNYMEMIVYIEKTPHMTEGSEEEKERRKKKTYIYPRTPDKTLLAVNQMPKQRVVVKSIHKRRKQRDPNPRCIHHFRFLRIVILVRYGPSIFRTSNSQRY